jgi:hypothetical protein
MLTEILTVQNKKMRYRMVFSVLLIWQSSLCQSFTISSALLFGTESNNINIRADRWKSVKDHYKDVTNKNAKAVMLEIKYFNPKLKLGSTKYYPLLMTGYAKDLFSFNYTQVNLPIVFDFSECSWLNGLLLGGSFHPKKIKDYNFFMELGIVNRRYPIRVDEINNVDTGNYIYSEIHLTSHYKNSFGLIFKSGVDLKLKERSSLSFGITRLSSVKTIVTYSFYRRESGLGEGGKGDNNGYYDSKINKYWYFNVGYHYNITLKKR